MGPFKAHLERGPIFLEDAGGQGDERRKEEGKARPVGLGPGNQVKNFSSLCFT